MKSTSKQEDARMDMIKVTAKTVEEAVTKALIELEITRDRKSVV